MRIFLACVALAAALLAPGLLVGPSLDAAVFAEVAERMRAGAMLYVDAWDHKPPGVYLLLVAARTLLPWFGPWLVSWIVSVLATAATATTLHAICRRLGLSALACWVAAVGALVVMGQYLTALGGGLTEPFATLLLAVALLLALGSWGRDDQLVRPAAVGAVLGLAAMLSVQVLPAILPIGWLMIPRNGKSAATGISVLVAGIAGFLAPLVLVAAWLTVIGSFGGATDAVLTYTAAYRSVAGRTGVALGGPVLAWTLLALLFLAVPAAMGAAEGRRRGGVWSAAALASMAWIGIAIVSFAVQGRLFAHYVIPLSIPLALLAGLGAERLRALPKRHRSRLLLPIAATCVISALAAGVAGAMELGPISRDHAQSVAIAKILDQESEAEDRIWVWGNEPEVYLDSDRESATSYSYMYPLVTPGYTTPALIAATLADLERDPPKLIVDAGSTAPGQPGFQQLLIPRPLASDGRDLDLLDPLRGFVRERYTELDRTSGWVVYVRRDSAGAPDARRGSSQLRLAATRR
ncbi:MAG TPA: hypothetical protein VHU77_08575 [Candidatus Limnocylindria bacterium]|nr:hypothetical protein [Candidatus Limnocylindria bacterium]